MPIARLGRDIYGRRPCYRRRFFEAYHKRVVPRSLINRLLLAMQHHMHYNDGPISPPPSSATCPGGVVEIEAICL